VKLLLTKGAEVNAKTIYGKSALMAAAERGDTVSVRSLLAKSADVNSRDQDGKNALNHALENGHQKVVQLLRQAGAKI